jgi:hypothetical protein
MSTGTALPCPYCWCNASPKYVDVFLGTFMIIKTIGVNYNRRFNLGNFEYVELSCHIWARISDYEDEVVCTEILQSHAPSAVRNEFIKVKSGSEPVEIFSVNTKTPPEQAEQEDFEDFLPTATVYRQEYEND